MPKAAPKAKRASVTDGMATVTEKLASGVERKLIKFVERDGFYVVESGDRGHPKYIYNIRERWRVNADNFYFDGKVKKWKEANHYTPQPMPQKHKLDTSGAAGKSTMTMKPGKFKASIKDADSDSEDDQVLLSNRCRATTAAGKSTMTVKMMMPPPANVVPLSAKQVHEKIAQGVPVVAAVEIVKKPTPPPKRKRAESDASKMAEELRKEKEKNKKLERELRQFKKKKSEDGAAAASKTADDDQGVEIACGIRIEELD